MEPVEYFNRLPQRASFDRCYILDPMIATGGTASAAIELVRDLQVPKIIFVTVCVSRPGLEAIQEHFGEKNVIIYAAAIDEEVNAAGAVVPGLGDVSSRLYSTVE